MMAFFKWFLCRDCYSLIEVLGMQNFDLDDFNILDMNAKKVLEALSEFNEGEFAKGEQIHKKTGLTPAEINEAVRELEKSLLVDNPDISRGSPPYDFYAVQITDFGRQVLEKYR
jgi:DNA-binding MarR family transcriptional regulator